MPPRPATVLHASDCHLGSGPQSRHEQDFARIIDFASSDAVDVLLVTGDLFDHARVSDTTLGWAAEQFDRAGCPVVVLPGNHDLYHDASVYRRLDFAARCRQVQVFTDQAGEVLEVPGHDLVIWGRAMDDHAPDFRPVVGVPPRPADRWCIVAGHGLVIPTDEGSTRGSPIYPSDLDAIDWDYVALGHAGVFRVVREAPVPVCYAGPDHGPCRGATLVELLPGVGARPRFVVLDDVAAHA